MSIIVLTEPSADSGSTANSIAQSILHRQNVQSQHRLNQPRLQNASSLNASDVKRKVSALKANARAANIDIDFTLQPCPMTVKGILRKLVEHQLLLS